MRIIEIRDSGVVFVTVRSCLGQEKVFRYSYKNFENLAHMELLQHLLFGEKFLVIMILIITPSID